MELPSWVFHPNLVTCPPLNKSLQREGHTLDYSTTLWVPCRVNVVTQTKVWLFSKEETGKAVSGCTVDHLGQGQLQFSMLDD